MRIRRRSAMTSALSLLVACGSAGGGSDGEGAGTARSVASASAQGAGGSPGSSGAGGESPLCDAYATEPVGVEIGDVLDPEAELSGLLEGGPSKVDVVLGDLRDCDGRSGVDAVLLIAARASCGTCRREAETLTVDAARWREAGVRTVVLLSDGDIDLWRSTYGLDDVVILADPARTLDLPEPPREPSGGFVSTPNGTPLFVVLDPRTGRIHDRHLGADYDFASLLALAADNRAAR